MEATEEVGKPRKADRYQPPVFRKRRAKSKQPDTVLVVALLGILVLSYFLTRPLLSTRVSLDLEVSALEWENADEPGKDLDWFGLAIESSDTTSFRSAPAHILANTTSGKFTDTAPIELLPTRAKLPVRVDQLAFPPGGRVRLAQPDSKRLQLAVSPKPAAATQALLSWHLSFRQKLYVNPQTGQLALLKGAHIDSTILGELQLEKMLQPSEEYVFDFTQPHEWKAPARLMARTLAFNERNPAGTQAISSVLAGKVKLLDTNEAPLELAERDVVQLVFERPVELAIRGTAQHLVVHVDGVASQIFCGPKIMGKDNDLRPLRIKYYYDKTPYTLPTLTLLLTLYPLLLRRKT